MNPRYELAKDQAGILAEDLTAYSSEFLGPHSYGFHRTTYGVIENTVKQMLPDHRQLPDSYTPEVQQELADRKTNIEQMPEGRVRRRLSVARKFSDGAIYLTFRTMGVAGGLTGLTQDQVLGFESDWLKVGGMVSLGVALRGVPATTHDMVKFYNNLDPDSDQYQVALYEDAIERLDGEYVHEITPEISNTYFHPLGAKIQKAVYNEQEGYWERETYLSWPRIIGLNGQG